MRSNIRTIVFLSYHFPPEVGGIQTRISNYCENLSARGIAVVVLFPTKSARYFRSYDKFGAQIYTLPGPIKYLFLDVSLLARLAIARRADAIHVFTGASTVLGLVALVLARILNIPSVMSIFGREDVSLPTRPSRTILSLSEKIATTITTNSEATKSLLSKKLYRKCKVLLGGAKIVEKEPTESLGQNKVILFVGRLAKRKGLDDLIEAFALIEGRILNSRLVIVGDGAEREELDQKVSQLGLSRVEFKGSLFGESLSDQYSLASVCVLPSKSVEGDTASEGLGLTLIEASMHGKPLVGTIHGGIPEIIKDGVNGFLVPEGDWRSLSEALTKLLLDEDLAKKMGSNALQMARKRLSWKAATERLLQAYQLTD